MNGKLVENTVSYDMTSTNMILKAGLILTNKLGLTQLLSGVTF
jgi:hypothetical protein